MHGLCSCLPSLPKILALKPVSCLWLNLYMGLRGCATVGMENIMTHITLTSKVDSVKVKGAVKKGRAFKKNLKASKLKSMINFK